MSRHHFFSFLLIAALVVAALGLAGCASDGDANGNNNSGEASPEAQQERSQPVAAVEVRPRDLSQTITVSNPIEALRTVSLAAQMTGTVEEVLVEEGDWVEAGQVLARLDLTEQQAELARARALLEQEEAAYERIQELRERDYSTAAEYEERRANLAVARSEVELWETRLAFGTITAPSNAVVSDRMIEPGEAVLSNDTLFELDDVSELVVRAGVSELNVSGLQPGQRATMRIDAVPNQEFSGSIRRVFPRADADSRMVRVEINVDPIEGVELRPGYLARVELNVDQREGTFAIPSESLLASEEDQSTVFVITDEELERRSVVVGVERRGWTEVLDGLEEGEHVVASNPANLQDGQRVRISNMVTHDSDPPDAADEPAASSETS